MLDLLDDESPRVGNVLGGDGRQVRKEDEKKGLHGFTLGKEVKGRGTWYLRNMKGDIEVEMKENSRYGLKNYQCGE